MQYQELNRNHGEAQQREYKCCSMAKTSSCVKGNATTGEYEPNRIAAAAAAPTDKDIMAVVFALLFSIF